MSTQLHNTGEELILDEFFLGDGSKPTGTDEIGFGLYYDASDSLSDSDNRGAITTQPGGSSYAIQYVDFSSTYFTNSYDSGLNGGAWKTVIDSNNEPQFDTSDSSQNVDAYYLIAYFNSDDAGTEDYQLVFSGDLDQMYDLNSVDTFTLSGGGLSLT